MYLFWKRNSLGGISISAEGMRSFVKNYLSRPYACDQISLSKGEDCLFVLITYPEGASSIDMEMTETRVRSKLESLGLTVRITWVQVEKGKFDGIPSLATLVKKPITWAVAGAAIFMLFFDGFWSLVRTLLLGAAFYFATVFFFSDKGERVIEKVKRKAGR